MNERIWQSILDEIELSVSHGSFLTWFKNTSLLQLKDDMATIGVANVFAKQQLETKYYELLKKTFISNGVNVKKLVFTIDSSVKKVPEAAGTVADLGLDAVPVKEERGKIEFRKIQDASGLNTGYRFSNFVVGASNELAYTACQAIVATPTKYNPLFVYGGVGLGKTHLIQAVGNEMIAKNQAAKVCYLTLEEFVNQFLDSIRNKRRGFADRYRSVDVLIVDDMQFIAGKEKTQEEFFHTFNALQQKNKQIIISSDKPPKSIPTLSERLRSRFEQGMTVDIQPPDFETRCAIVQTKAQYRGFELSQDTVDFLATHVQTNIRELEGALNQLLAFCEMRGVEPDTQLAMGLLNSSRVRPKHITIKQILDSTAKHFDLDQDTLCGPKRDKEIVVPRQIAMYLLRSELHLSYPRVAHELGRKDHTTAMHSVDKIEKSMAFDHVVRQHVGVIKERLYA